MLKPMMIPAASSNQLAPADADAGDDADANATSKNLATSLPNDCRME